MGDIRGYNGYWKEIENAKGGWEGELEYVGEDFSG
jgi:hypothetical protein